MVVAFNLLLSLREVQLQHGLRSDDWAKYRAYLTGRIKTLRKQLKLSMPHKRVVKAKKDAKVEPTYMAPKEVTPLNAHDPRHVTLLALQCERAWAESEVLRAASTAAVAQNETLQRHGGSAATVIRHSRARLGAALHHAHHLKEVVDAVGDAALKAQVAAYTAEMEGRREFLRADFAAAKELFLDARARYFALERAAVDGGSVEVRAVLSERRSDCDNRIVTCMRRLGQDAAQYRPAVNAAATGADAGAGTTLGTTPWLGRALNVVNVTALDWIQRAEAENAFAAAAAVTGGAAAVEAAAGLSSASWWLYQQQSATNKAQDSFDRAVGLLQDALTLVAADLRSAVAGTEAASTLRLLQHCLTFRRLMCVAHRGYLASAAMGARLVLSVELLHGAAGPGGRLPGKRLPAALPAGVPALPTKELHFTAAQLVSPVDVVRAFDLVLASLQEAALLPGVEDNAAFKALIQRVRAERLFYMSMGWDLVGDAPQRLACLNSAAALIGTCAPAKGDSTAFAAAFSCVSPALAAPREVLEGRVAGDALVATAVAVAPTLGEEGGVALGAQRAGAAGSSTSSAAAAVRVAGDDLDSLEPCQAFATFPPPFQAAPCKPAFVDIAGTYLSFPGAAASPVSPTPSPASRTTGAAAAAAQGDDKKQGWLGGWFRR
jgi:signal recognition particle subunit SRP68